MQPRVYSGFGLAVVWLTTSLLVFAALDAMATREFPLEVERFRVSGMSDAEVIAAAVQEARKRERNVWWIHGREPVLVFDELRAYSLDSLEFDTFDLEIVSDRHNGLIGRVTLLREPIYY